MAQSPMDISNKCPSEVPIGILIQCYLLSSLMTWMKESSAFSTNLQMTPNWGVQWILLKDGMPCRGTWISSRNRPVEVLWGLIGPRIRWCTCIRATLNINTSWEMRRSKAVLLRRTQAGFAGAGEWEADTSQLCACNPEIQPSMLFYSFIWVFNITFMVHLDNIDGDQQTLYTSCF